MEDFQSAFAKSLHAYATRTEGVSVSPSCVNRAYEFNGRNFLFVGEKSDHVRVMLKLAESKDEAMLVSFEGLKVGSSGWVTLLCPPDEAPNIDILHAWIDESFRVLSL